MPATTDTRPAPTLRWAYRPPTVAGLYWFQPVAESPVLVVRVKEPSFYAESMGRWSGPIAAPDGSEPWAGTVEGDLGTDVGRCQYPGCSEPALCRSGNFHDALICAKHLAIVNEAEAYRQILERS